MLVSTVVTILCHSAFSSGYADIVTDCIVKINK